MVVVAHPTGSPWVRSDIRALHRARRLAAFYTTIAVPPWIVRFRAWPASLRQEISRRSFHEIPQSKIVAGPLKELVRLGARTAGLRVLTRHEVGWASVDAVYHDVDRRLARDLEAGKIKASTVIAYEDASLETFRTARRLGMRSVYHLPIAYWRLLHQLLAEERERRPEWAATMEGLGDSPAKHHRKDLELAQADLVVVPSNFVRQTLAHAPKPPLGPVEVVPYGAPPTLDRRHAPADERGRPLRALFVGQLSQRKGLADLDEAMRHVRGLVTLTLVGPRTTQACAALDHVIQTHRWIPPVAHAQVLQLMTEHDVLVLPTLAEGFALVINEALSRGLPVITTPHSGASDLMTDGQDGFTVPIRNPEAITDRLTRLAEDREMLAQMSLAALETARRHPWSRYEERIAQIVADPTYSGTS